MNTPNPLIPQGSLQQHSSGKSTVRIAVFTIVAIHAVFFTGLLMQGCGRDTTEATNKSAEPTNILSDLGKLTNEYYANAIDLPAVINAETRPPTNNLLEQPVAHRFEGNSGPGQPTVPSTLPPSLPPVQLPNISQTPPPNPAPTPVAELQSKEYTVVSGDSFYKIAGLHDISLAELKNANPGVDPAKIRPGQKIVIPPGSSDAAAGTAASKSTTGETINPSGEWHVVRAGEYLTKIAKQHGTTVKALRAANNLKSDRLAVGQKLRIPESAKSRTSNLSASNRVGASTTVR